jgi:hypothetical protein
MRRLERAAVLATSAATAVGAATSAYATAPMTAQPSPPQSCPTLLGSPTQTGALAAKAGAGGAVTVYGQGSSAQQSPLTFHFDFGDGYSVTQSTPIAQHTYAFNADFGPTVTVTDANGTTASSALCDVLVSTVANSVHRYAGDDRYLTSTAVSGRLWASAVGDTTERLQAKAVVLASGEGFADALAGVPLAAYKQGPLLLTERNQLTQTTEDEIRRVLPQGSTVYVLGGSSALSPAIDAKLHSDGYSVTRFGGKDRYGTAMRIATAGLGNPASVVVVTGLDFADALAAGPLATGDQFTAQGKPAAIVLSEGGRITDPATAAFVRARLGDVPGPTPGSLTSHAIALGAQAVCAVSLVDSPSGPMTCFIPPEFYGQLYSTGTVNAGIRNTTYFAIAGIDRYQTAAAAANTHFASYSTGTGPWLDFEFSDRFGLASGTSFPDALTGGAAMAVLHAPIVLTERDFFSSATATYVNAIVTAPVPNTIEADIFGGPAAVGPGLEATLNARIKR